MLCRKRRIRKQTFPPVASDRIEFASMTFHVRKHNIFIDHTHWQSEDETGVRRALLALNVRSASLSLKLSIHCPLPLSSNIRLFELQYIVHVILDTNVIVCHSLCDGAVFDTLHANNTAKISILFIVDCVSAIIKIYSLTL